MRSYVPTFHSHHILAPRRREKFELVYESIYPRRCHDGDWGAFEKLVRVNEEGSRSEGEKNILATREREEEARGLEQLPAELMHSVLEFLDEESVIRLGYVSKGMWNSVIGFVLREVKAATGCWAGTSILYVGNTTMVRDAPECLKDDIGDMEPRHWVKHVVNGYSGVRSPGHWPTILESCLQEDKDEDSQELTSRDWRIPESLKVKIEAAIQALRKPQTCRLWILRNLTEKKFVRLELISDPNTSSESPHHIHVDNEPKLSLNKILLRWICLSGSPNSRAGKKGKWGGPCTEWTGPKGDWAGHRFDVVPSSQMELNEEWEDVTRIVVGVEVALGFVGREGIKRDFLTASEFTAWCHRTIANEGQ